MNPVVIYKRQKVLGVSLVKIMESECALEQMEMNGLVYISKEECMNG